MIRLWRYEEKAVVSALSARCFSELRTFVSGNHVDPGLSTMDAKTISSESCRQPLFAFFSDPAGKEYRYFKTLVKGLEFPPVLEELRRVAATKSDAPLFDAAFVNLYRSGDDFVGPHRECAWLRAPNSLLLLLRGTIFRRRPSNTADIRVDTILMHHGSLVTMLPGMQEK